MAGNAWKYSGVLDDYDLAFLQHDFITIKQGVEYYGFSERPFLRMAKEAGAYYKIGKEAFGQLDGNIPKIKDLNQEYAELLQKKKEAYSEYRTIKEENRELQMAKHNLERFLNQQEEEQKGKDKQHKKNEQSL